MTCSPGSTPTRAGWDDVVRWDDVVVALDEALFADWLADARWLLHDAPLRGARRIVVDLHRARPQPQPRHVVGTPRAT